MEQKSLHLYPNEQEAEKASNGYLMSLMMAMVGLPIPIVAWLSCAIYFLANRKSSSYFVRWHTMQMFLSQLFLIPFNSLAFWWSVNIFLFSSRTLTSQYVGYMLLILIVNVIELVANISAAVRTRKAIHVKWWFFSSLTDVLCKP